MQFQVFLGRIIVLFCSVCAVRSMLQKAMAGLHSSLTGTVTSLCFVLFQDYFKIDMLWSSSFPRSFCDRERRASLYPVHHSAPWNHLDLSWLVHMWFSPVRRSQQLVMSRASSGRERTFAHFTMSDFNSACDACGSPYPLLFFSSRRELTAFQADVKAGRAILSFLCRCSDTWRQFACRGSGLPMLALISILSRENASPAQTLWHPFGTRRNIGPIWTRGKEWKGLVRWTGWTLATGLGGERTGPVAVPRPLSEGLHEELEH